MEGAHRRIDVDAYDEERLGQDDLLPADVYAGRTPLEVEAETRARVNESRSALQRGDLATALSAILSHPPYGPGLESAKQAALTAILAALQSCRQTEIQGVLARLPSTEVDVLTKYIYRGMALVGEARPGSGWEDVNTAVLLGWHERIVDVAGPGTIMRTMTDHRTV